MGDNFLSMRTTGRWDELWLSGATALQVLICGRSVRVRTRIVPTGRFDLHDLTVTPTAAASDDAAAVDVGELHRR